MWAFLMIRLLSEKHENLTELQLLTLDKVTPSVYGMRTPEYTKHILVEAAWNTRQSEQKEDWISKRSSGKIKKSYLESVDWKEIQHILKNSFKSLDRIFFSMTVVWFSMIMFNNLFITH